METIASWQTISVTFVAAFLASGAGTGGGALYMPGYTIAYHGNTRSAAPLSKATIFGLAFASILLSIFQSRNKITRAAVYTVAALLEPATLFGTIIGVNLNLILPPLINLILLFCCLTFVSYQTLIKAYKLYCEECIQNGLVSQTLKVDIKQDLNSNSSSNGRFSTPSTDYNLMDRYTDSITQKSISSQSPVAELSHSVMTPTFHYQKKKFKDLTNSDIEKTALVYMICNWAVHALSLLAFGGPLAVLCGTTIQKCGFGFLMLFHLACIHGYGMYLQSHYDETESNSGQLLDYKICIISNFQWTESLKKTRIGGGLIKGPLMLYMGLSPIAAVSTATCMILLTSASTTLSFVLNGQLNKLNGLIFGIAAFCGSLIGQYLIGSLVERYKLQSIISFMLGSVVILSMFCLVALPFITRHQQDSIFTFSTAPFWAACHNFERIK